VRSFAGEAALTLADFLQRILRAVSRGGAGRQCRRSSTARRHEPNGAVGGASQTAGDHRRAKQHFDRSFPHVDSDEGSLIGSIASVMELALLIGWWGSPATYSGLGARSSAAASVAIAVIWRADMASAYWRAITPTSTYLLNVLPGG
jgi:hypothetical protein